MALCGVMWSCLALCCDIWPFVTFCGVFVALCGDRCSYLALSGFSGVFWRYVPLFAVMWRYVAMCGVMWRYVALCCVMWYYVAFCADMWCYVALFSFFLTLCGAL